MKRVIVLVTVALLALAIFAPAALAAQDTTMEDTAMEETTAAGGGAAGPLPESGGPAILLPAAALLLGSGILTFAVLRRR